MIVIRHEELITTRVDYHLGHCEAIKICCRESGGNYRSVLGKLLGLLWMFTAKPFDSSHTIRINDVCQLLHDGVIKISCDVELVIIREGKGPTTKHTIVVVHVL